METFPCKTCKICVLKTNRNHRKKYCGECSRKRINRRNLKYHRKRMKEDPYFKKHKAQISHDADMKIKISVLSHYGKNKKLQCRWKYCNIVDVDCLSIDHIFNDGNLNRKLAGMKLYRHLKKNQYPSGFQTLCHNHQWKKELKRRRKGIRK